jgi:glc operon protein GlcG
MTLNDAIALNDRGIAKARELGLALSFVVVDEFGQLVQLDRMDGASLMSPDLAEAKAITALNFKRPTSEVATLSPAELQAISEIAHFKVLAVPGGLPIQKNGAIVGALGVAGATAQKEELVARHVLSD